MEKAGEMLREKILIIQDVPSYHLATPDLLSRSGYATAVVQQRSRALDKVSQESPDLVILDLGNSSQEGVDLLAQLRSDRFTQHIPLFVVGPPGPVANRTFWIRNGADDCLEYPYHPEVLHAHIRALLRRSVPHDPVTHLPTGAYLQRQVDAWLARNILTAVLYVDIDHFASYNSAYGHEAGNIVLQYLARLIIDVLPNGIVSIGHLGEDDFMMAFPPPGVETFVETLIDRFAAAQREFYDESDLARGYLPEMNSSQPPRLWPLMTLSAARVTNEHRALTNFLRASFLLSRLMLMAKARGGDRSVGENI